MLDDSLEHELAPVVFFCFRRLRETKESLLSLKENYLASNTCLYIFSDGPRTEAERGEVEDVRSYIRSITGFRRVFIEEAPLNKGLARSVIEGVGAVLNKHGRAIIVEDDLITSPNFLDFMNQALLHYEGIKSILSISGYTLRLPSLPESKDYYVGYRASSWGWATWEDRWVQVDWRLTDYERISRDVKFRHRLSRGGVDLPRMLKHQVEGRIDSWAIRFCYHQAKFNLYTIFPSSSKVISIGYGPQATHTTYSRRFETTLDVGEKRYFEFDDDLLVDQRLAREFGSKFSVVSRILDRLFGSR